MQQRLPVELYVMIFERCWGGENIDDDRHEFQFVDPKLVRMIFWQVIDLTVDFWIPDFPVYLPPVLELTGATAHTPACGGILSNACIGFSVNEMTQRFDPTFGFV